MSIPFTTLKERWNADPAFRKAYDKISPEMEIAFAIAEARHRAKLTQAQLAYKIGSSQAMVARWERGTTMPSTKSLTKVAQATGSRLRVQLDAG
ncbi:HTH-type transcriptional regulator/antitoxin HipB [Phyllobacterium sp. 1468]|uniref:helix-turn-helix domain-containing protein n=1 Tax=Phyllobacterium sp. 1468 TaxID=2817759 RepID=UPI00285B62D4|nr:helix-turn-helix transcriptional regulator [Phyllobacterium sp. 1468]MDR6632703.1 HTH-type transcriptional regulator/antitoxin HipB [Phyllobacterium sp. 1468]